jgi:hypothetical protein
MPRVLSRESQMPIRIWLHFPRVGSRVEGLLLLFYAACASKDREKSRDEKSSCTS